jgi:hypothetical protein
LKHRCLLKIIVKFNGELTHERHAEAEMSPFACDFDINIKEESIPKGIASFLVDRVNTDRHRRSQVRGEKRNTN